MGIKVCVVITARPSYSRIKTALSAIKDHPDLELQLVVAASALLDRYGTVIENIENDGFKIAAKVFMVLEGENLTSMAKTTGLGLMELSTVFYNLQPDMVVTVADRYETIATAIAASYMNIPLTHIQGGEVTGSIDEKVRHAVTKLSDLHLVSTDKSAQRVIKMGEDPAKVFVTGCPSNDIAAELLKSPEFDFDLIGRYGGLGAKVDTSKDYIVVMQHPVTTEYELSRQQIQETIDAIQALDMQTILFWPNVDAGSDGTSKAIRTFREEVKENKVRFFKNMEPVDFLKVIYNSRCLIGNSSVGIRESSFLGIPVINIGSRQNGRERGQNVIDVDYDSSKIVAAVKEHLTNGHYPSDTLYGKGSSGAEIARIIAKVPLSIKKRLMY